MHIAIELRLSQAAPCVGVSEHELAKALPVDAAITHDPIAKLQDHCRKARGARLVDGVSRLVCVHHQRAEVAHHHGHGGLS